MTAAQKKNGWSRLSALRGEAERLRVAFESLVASKYPGFDQWHWFRALEHSRPNPIGRPNDDRSRDATLAADQEIACAYDAYIAALHLYCGARDGEHGFLGTTESSR